MSGDDPAFSWVEAEKDLMDGIDTSVPYWSRTWNHWLGGKDNYPLDQDMGDQIAWMYPEIIDLARVSRHFLLRVVRYLADQEGIGQFIDIGAGFPDVDNTHEIAQRVHPQARTVYVNHDPLVLAHARALLNPTPPAMTAHLDADVRDLGAITDGAARTLDFTMPVAVLLRDVHFLTDDEAQHAVDRLTRDLPFGSHLVVTHNTTVVHGVRTVAAFDHWNTCGRPHIRTRTPEAIGALLDGMELLEPGVVTVPRWRPEHTPWGVAAAVDQFCAVARRPRQPDLGCGAAHSAARPSPAQPGPDRTLNRNTPHE